MELPTVVSIFKIILPFCYVFVHLALAHTLFSPPNTPVPEVQQVLLPTFVVEEVSLRG